MDTFESSWKPSHLWQKKRPISYFRAGPFRKTPQEGHANAYSQVGWFRRRGYLRRVVNLSSVRDGQPKWVDEVGR